MIWYKAYAEEYFGLQQLPAWVTINESEYQRIKHKAGTLLPKMEIRTLKYYELGKPKREKYHIVELENLDPHTWDRQDVFAPVMSILEVRLLTALKVRNQRKLKAGDFKQAFVQSTSPTDETYVLRPPAGCPHTPKNSYWLLKRSLYGLRIAPRYWFDKLTKIFHSIGLKQYPHAPCIFTGTIIPNAPPIYLGFYVDEFIYFSESDAAEKEF